MVESPIVVVEVPPVARVGECHSNEPMVEEGAEAGKREARSSSVFSSGERVVR